MQFVNPFFLLALGTLAIPVLIHLFNFRRFKKVYFTNVRFLQELQQETKKQSRLRDLLILIARLLAIASLVIAFAGPYIPASRQQKVTAGQKVVSLYIDNSFSMEAVATDGKLIDLAKARAKEIASAYNPSDLFQVLTNDFEARHQHLVNREEFIRLTDEIQVSAATRNISEVITRQSNLLNETRNRNYDAFLISDFQKSTSSLATAKPDPAVSWFLVPLKADKRNNLFIDTLWFASPVHQPGQPSLLRVRIRNTGNESLEKIPVKLTINAVQKALTSFSIDADATAEITLPYTENLSGTQYGQVEVVDYPIVYDDKFYFSYDIRPSIQVLCISEKENNRFLDALFAGDSSVRLYNCQVNQVNYGNLNLNSLIILNSPEELSSGLIQEISRFVNNGGHLAIFPPAKGNLDSYNRLLSLFNSDGYRKPDTVRQRISGLNLESELFSGVFQQNASGRVILPENADLPLVFKHFQIPVSLRSNTEPIMKFPDNLPFLASLTAGKGKIYLFGCPLDETWSQFPKHVIFVPVMYRMALLSNPSYPLYYTIGNDQPIMLPGDSVMESNIFKIKKANSTFEFIPGISKFGSNLTLSLHGQIHEAGFYNLVSERTPATGIAFNYNRKESDLSCLSASDLENQAKRLSVKDIHVIQAKKSSLVKELRQIRQGTPLWKLFVILALFFLAIETFLIRFVKQG